MSPARRNLEDKPRRIALAGMALVCAGLLALALAGCWRAYESAAAAGHSSADASEAELAAAPPAVDASGPASRWPVFRGDARGNGLAAGPLPEHLDVVWTFASEQHGFEATAVIADGLVFAGSLDGNCNTYVRRWPAH